MDGRAEPALTLARDLGQVLPTPGGGRTADRWQALAALAVGDLTAARVVEAHTDALAILDEWQASGATDPYLTALGVSADSTWGVFAAEGRGVSVDASRTRDGWVLSGIKPWCSLAGRLTHALITAHTGDGARRLFAIALRQDTVDVAAADGWVARGLTEVPSGPIELLDCPAVPVGADGWYLTRPGFAWGGIGVAACWYGGAVGLARRMRDAATAKEPDQIAAMHLGAVDVALTGSRTVLAAAASAVDAGDAAGAAGVLWAGRTRAVVANAAEEVLTRCGHTLGPAPLAQDAWHARRVADLQLYLRQHHAERDEAALGRQVLELAEWI